VKHYVYMLVRYLHLYRGVGGSVGSVDFSLLRGSVLCVLGMCVAVCVLCGDRLVVCLVIAL